MQTYVCTPYTPYILHNPHISSVRCYPCSWRPPRGVKLQEVHITSLVRFFHIIIVRIIYNIYIDDYIFKKKRDYNVYKYKYMYVYIYIHN